MESTLYRLGLLPSSGGRPGAKLDTKLGVKEYKVEEEREKERRQANWRKAAPEIEKRCTSTPEVAPAEGEGTATLYQTDCAFCASVPQEGVQVCRILWHQSLFSFSFLNPRLNEGFSTRKRRRHSDKSERTHTHTHSHITWHKNMRAEKSSRTEKKSSAHILRRSELEC